MIRSSKVRTVAWFEFLSTLKRKAYLIVTFGMPVFLALYGGAIAAIGYFTAPDDDGVKVYGIVDMSGLLDLESGTAAPTSEIPQPLQDALERIAGGRLLSGSMPLGDRAVFRRFENEGSAREALMDRGLDAYYLLRNDFLLTGAVEEYRSEQPGLSRSSGARVSLGRFIRDRLLDASVPREVSRRVRDPIEAFRRFVVRPGGEVVPDSGSASVARLVVPMAFTMLLFVSLMISAGYLVQGTAIEKENKVVEVILASVNPEEILLGKLLGLGGAGLLQVSVWFGMIVVGGLAFAASLAALGVEIPWLAMGVGVVLFTLAYLFLGSLMLGVGSLGNNQREGQQYSAIWSLIAVIPMMLLGLFVRDPHHPAAIVMSWIPFTAPITLLLRLSMDPTGVAWWEIAGPLVVLLFSIWGAILLGARLFRVGLLMTGSRPKLREILRQARLG